MAKGATLFKWDGEAMRPAHQHAQAKAAEQFVPGRVYRLAQVVERSKESHDEFFALLEDAWLTLPDEWKHEFPTVTHLRKRALIVEGYCNVTKHVLSTPRDALVVAALLKGRDEFSLVVTEGCIVDERVAKSQSMAAMPTAGEFERSKEAVLTYTARILQVELHELRDALKNAETRERPAKQIA